jgi:transcriptional regulator with XRE-family HTH domain
MKVHARAFRARSGLTQVVLALYSDCALETLRKLERGDVEGMRVETVIRIAAALGVPPSDLVPALGIVTAREKAPNQRRGLEIPACRWSLRPAPKGLCTEGDPRLRL